MKVSDFFIPTEHQSKIIDLWKRSRIEKISSVDIKGISIRENIIFVDVVNKSSDFNLFTWLLHLSNSPMVITGESSVEFLSSVATVSETKGIELTSLIRTFGVLYSKKRKDQTFIDNDIIMYRAKVSDSEVKLIAGLNFRSAISFVGEDIE